ncbi:MAG: hypothetical protein FJ095_05125 [Deltaproteobacteria bacterium]|nr:hypothetical protein [Deltaproteobacteria bacterium]
MKLYRGAPYRIVGVSKELAQERDREPSAVHAAEEPVAVTLDLALTEEPARVFRCGVALAGSWVTTRTPDGAPTFDHYGVLSPRDTPAPDESGGPGAVLYTEDAIAPEPGAAAEPRELFGPCLLIVPAGAARRRLLGAYLMLGAPEGTRDLVNAGKLPTPTRFRYAAFVGAEHRFASADTVPLVLRAGAVTTIVDLTQGSPLMRPTLL